MAAFELVHDVDREGRRRRCAATHTRENLGVPTVACAEPMRCCRPAASRSAARFYLFLTTLANDESFSAVFCSVGSTAPELMPKSPPAEEVALRTMMASLST